VNKGFAAGTLILTKEGRKPIEEICIGDLILSFPDDKAPPQRRRLENEYTYQKVTSVTPLENQSISSLKILCTASGLVEIFKTGQRQEIFVKGYGWASVSGLKFCGVINSVFGNSMLTKVEHDIEVGCLYWIELENMYTLYIGEVGVWVHAL